LGRSKGGTGERHDCLGGGKKNGEKCSNPEKRFLTRKKGHSVRKKTGGQGKGGGGNARSLPSKKSVSILEGLFREGGSKEGGRKKHAIESEEIEV